MKISKTPKKKVNACEAVPVPDTTVIGNPSEIMTVASPYDNAKDFIQSAINSLASVAANDPIAKESIANLAVVLFDLQGC